MRLKRTCLIKHPIKNTHNKFEFLETPFFIYKNRSRNEVTVLHLISASQEHQSS